MYLASIANAVTPMVAFRFLTGIGIGGMLAATNAVTAESSNTSWRKTAIAAYVAGYPLGAIIGGIAASEWLLPDHGWRAVFVFGAVVTAALIPVVMLLVPETAAYHAGEGQSGRASTRRCAAFGKPAIDDPAASRGGRGQAQGDRHPVEPEAAPGHPAAGVRLHVPHHHLLLHPQVRGADRGRLSAGISAADAATVLTWANVGGFTGSLLFGFVMAQLGIKWPTALMLLIGAVAVASFGLGRDTLDGWQWATILTGFFTNAAISGYYAAFARGFPAYARATGTGFVLGVGRLGAAGSPIIAGRAVHLARQRRAADRLGHHGDGLGHLAACCS